MSQRLRLSQLDLIKISCVNKTRKLSQRWLNSKRYRPTISIDLYFKRNAGIYLVEVYIPCVILVMTSFCSFFINREATNVRILIGSMTTLSMIILSIENRLLVKNVPYFTAIDYFVMISFVFIFASILEYIFVHHHTKIAYGDIGTFSNWIPLDRIAKLVYSSLQPKQQISSSAKRVSPNPLNINNQLVAIVRNEPMIYDLPITENFKDDQTILMNNLLLNNNQTINPVIYHHSNTLSLRRPTATNLIDPTIQLSNYSTFPRTNHSSSSNLAYQTDYNSRNQLSDSPSNDLIINANNLANTSLANSNLSRTLKKRLASIPEEAYAASQQEITNLKLADNLKLLRDHQEQQLEEQQNYQLNQLRNVVFELERSSNLVEFEANLVDCLNNEASEKNDNKKDEKKDKKISNKLGYRINKMVNAKRLSTTSVVGQFYYDFLASLFSQFKLKSSNQTDNYTINQLNSISNIDQVCRLLFPLLYLLFILSYYLLFVI